jgi:spore maturation protein CgeB
LRFYERLEVLQALVSRGVVVDVYGHGYEELSIAGCDCLRIHGAADSAQCLQAMQQAKVSLNVMPWFREGAHDRIFNAMANGSVCVTDTSRYLDEILTDGEDIVFYDLLDLPKMVDTVKSLLGEPERLWRIQNRAQKTVEQGHLWSHRAAWLEKQMRTRGPFT